MDKLHYFWSRFQQVPRNASFSEEDEYRRVLGREMVEWAKEVDKEVDPSCLEDAVMRAFACVVCKAAEEGMSPGWEVFALPPEQTTHEGSGSWRICWESGPYQWGVGDSLGAGNVVPERYVRGHDFHTEPHHSFDLCFFPES